MKLILVGIEQDNGKLDHLRVYENPTWALKYAKDAGTAARFAEVDVVFNTTPPAPRVDKKAKSEI
jgi:hypothetical protein